MAILTRFLFSVFFIYSLPSCVQAQEILKDTNQDGEVRILAFGDSLTFGIGDGGLGDGISGQGGYPARLETLLGVPVDNEGIPGEELAQTGYLRFPGALRSSSADIVLILEGDNDAFREVPSEQYGYYVQRVANVSRVLGKQAVLMTLTIPCCNHAQLVLPTNRYTAQIQRVALANDLPVVDLQRTWLTTCSNPNNCELYNLPEGLHPNANGYTAIAQTSAATLLGINLFSAEGASELEGSLGLPEGSVIVKPDPAAITE